jgi:hypothetical protein
MRHTRRLSLASATKKFEKIAGACKDANFFGFASLAVGFLLSPDDHFAGDGRPGRGLACPTLPHFSLFFEGPPP